MDNLNKLVSYLAMRSDMKEDDMKRVVKLGEIVERDDSDSLEILEMVSAIISLMESDSFNLSSLNELLFELLESLKIYFLINEVNENVSNVEDNSEVEDLEIDEDGAYFDVEFSSVRAMRVFLLKNVDKIGLQASDLNQFCELVQEKDHVDLVLEELNKISVWSEINELVLRYLSSVSSSEVYELGVGDKMPEGKRLNLEVCEKVGDIDGYVHCEGAFIFEFEDFEGLKKSLYELISGSTKISQFLDSIFKLIEECEDHDRDLFRDKMMSYFKNKVLKIQKEDINAFFAWLSEFKDDVESFNKEKEEAKKNELLSNMPRPKIDKVVDYSKFVKRVSVAWHPDKFPDKVNPESISYLNKLHGEVASKYKFSGDDHKAFELETNNNLKSFLDELQKGVIQLFEGEKVSDTEICELFESYISRVHEVWSIDVGDSEKVQPQDSNESSTRANGASYTEEKSKNAENKRKENSDSYEYKNYEEESTSGASNSEIYYEWMYGTKEVNYVSDKELILSTPGGIFKAEKVQKSNVVIGRSINFDVVEFDSVNVFLKGGIGHMDLEHASYVRNTSIIDEGFDMVCRVSSNFVESFDFIGSSLEFNVSSDMVYFRVKVSKKFTGYISQMKHAKIEFDARGFESFELKANEVDDLHIICSNDFNPEKEIVCSKEYHIEIDSLNNSTLRLFNGARVKIGSIDDHSFVSLDNLGKLYVDYGNETYIVERKSKSVYDIFSIPTLSTLKTSKKGIFGKIFGSR